jgi:hypothetical protein
MNHGIFNHGYEPQSKLWKHSAASCGVLYPCLCGISLCALHKGQFDLPISMYYVFEIGVSLIRLTNFYWLRFRSLSLIIIGSLRLPQEVAPQDRFLKYGSPAVVSFRIVIFFYVNQF